MNKAFTVRNDIDKQKMTIVMMGEMVKVLDDEKRTIIMYVEKDGNLEPTLKTGDEVLDNLPTNPGGCNTAEAYYNRTYNKALRGNTTDNITFLHKTDPVTLMPLN